MVYIDGVKYACERCIRGHRVSTCKHSDQPLTMIKPKGRPATQCTHCREARRSRLLHTRCQCGASSANIAAGLSTAACNPSSTLTGVSRQVQHAHQCPCYVDASKCTCTKKRASSAASSRRNTLSSRASPPIVQFGHEPILSSPNGVADSRLPLLTTSFSSVSNGGHHSAGLGGPNDLFDRRQSDSPDLSSTSYDLFSVSDNSPIGYQQLSYDLSDVGSSTTATQMSDHAPPATAASTRSASPPFLTSATGADQYVPQDDNNDSSKAPDFSLPDDLVSMLSATMPESMDDLSGLDLDTVGPFGSDSVLESDNSLYSMAHNLSEPVIASSRSQDPSAPHLLHRDHALLADMFLESGLDASASEPESDGALHSLPNELPNLSSASTDPYFRAVSESAYPPRAVSDPNLEWDDTFV